MGGTEAEDERHSTVPADPRPRLRRRFFGALVLIGLLVGMMIGRLTTPEPARLIAVQSVADGLQLRFNAPAQYQSQALEGAYAVLLQARGSERAGQLVVSGETLRWRIQPGKQGLLLDLVALRELQVQTHEREDGGDWLLELKIAVQAGR